MIRIAHLDDRAVLRVSGEEARDFLQGLITQDVRAVAPGRPAWGALLSPQGKYLFDMFLHEEAPDSLLLDVEGCRADELLKRLTIYRLRRGVTLERTGARVLAAWGGSPDEQPDKPLDPRLPAAGRRWLEPEGAPAPSPTATRDEYDRHRLALGLPDGSRDMMVDRLLWLEANAEALHGVSFAKGCFVGQENTARMHYRDKVLRRLLPVELEAEPAALLSAADGAGAAGRIDIMGEQRAAGELRSTNGRLGIAWLRVAQVTEALTVAGAPLRVIWPNWLDHEAPADAVGDA